jgi:hypothetical protein
MTGTTGIYKMPGASFSNLAKYFITDAQTIAAFNINTNSG